MANVLDVAAYILEKIGEATAMKLQKLVFYSQAWSLVWEEEPLFDDPIQAWANGPVTPTLYQAHRGMFKIAPGMIGGNPTALSGIERENVDIVLAYYGDKSAQWLSDLTHMEAPWNAARDRAGVSDGDNCAEVIRLDDMAEYYSGLRPQ